MNNDRLPKLPGMTFDDHPKVNHHVPQCFNFLNGYRTYNRPATGIGKDPLKGEYKEYCGEDESLSYDPILTYGCTKRQQVKPFIPHYVIYDKKTLKFTGFFRQHVPESRLEHYRTRFVNIFYFLEDDTITVIEPFIKNSGFPQGRLVRRGKISKHLTGIFYTWKDFNIGVDMQFNGIVFHITDCDPFTRDYLEANGIELNASECLPKDTVTIDKMIQDAQGHTHKTPSTDDKLRRFLDYTGKVLHYDCVLDETDRPFGELITFKLFYYLEDDTIAIKELKENQEGRDHFSMLLKRTKLPKNWQKKPAEFPGIIFNISDKEVEEFYQPKDLRIGETVFVFGRKFLLLDCDKFTRTYFDQVLRCPQPNKLEIQKPSCPEIKITLPDYLGLGTPEDSLVSCYHLVPKAPKKDLVSFLVNANKMLRYGCQFDTAHPEDKDRRFILCYSLADGTISIIEQSVPNSGITGGKFLSSRRLWRPDCNPNRPDYYTAKDLFIGALLKIFSHRFVITSTDLYVYRYMQSHPEMFAPDIIDNVRMYHLGQGNLKEEVRQAIRDDHKQYLLEQDNTKLELEAAKEAVTLNYDGQINGVGIPSPYIPEEEVKLRYHQDEETPEYMTTKCNLPCNFKVQYDELIPSDRGIVRFKEPYEK